MKPPGLKRCRALPLSFMLLLEQKKPYLGFVKNKAKNGLKVSAYADNYLLHQGFVRRKSFITQLFFFHHTEFSVDMSMFRKYKTS